MTSGPRLERWLERVTLVIRVQRRPTQRHARWVAYLVGDDRTLAQCTARGTAVSPPGPARRA
jgi:hypothetical protein